MSLIPEKLADQSPMTFWHVAKACHSISAIWPDTDEKTGLTTYPDPPKEHQIKWLELALKYYSQLPEQCPKWVPSLWNKSLCMARLSELLDDGNQILQDSMQVLDKIPTSAVAPMDGRALGHEARVRRALLTLQWAAEFWGPNSEESDEDYGSVFFQMVSRSIEGLREVPQTSEQWSAAASMYIDLAGTAMFRLKDEETEEESIELIKSAIVKSSTLERPHGFSFPTGLGGMSRVEHASIHWIRSRVRACSFMDVLAVHYLSSGHRDRARELTDRALRELGELTTDSKPIPRGIIAVHPESVYADIYFTRARMASEGDEELDEIEEIRSHLRHTDVVLDQDLDTINNRDHILDRRIRFGLHLLENMRGDILSASKEDFDTETESLTRLIEANPEFEGAEMFAQGLRYEIAQYRFKALHETLTREEAESAEITARVIDLNMSLEMVESKAAAYRMALSASNLHDNLYLHEDRVMDEELSQHIGMDVNQLSPARRKGAAELLASTIDMAIRFDDPNLEWETEGFVTIKAPDRHPQFRVMITDSILTYVALGYQDDFELLGEVYEIPEILRDFSESEDLSILYGELLESQRDSPEATEAEGDSVEVDHHPEHRKCQSICRIYLAWRAKGEVEELPGLDDYCSFHPNDAGFSERDHHSDLED